MVVVNFSSFYMVNKSCSIQKEN